MYKYINYIYIDIYYIIWGQVGDWAGVFFLSRPANFWK